VTEITSAGHSPELLDPVALAAELLALATWGLTGMLGGAFGNELRAALSVSRATLMRAVHAAGPEVLTIGRARRTSYAARRRLRGSADPLPVFQIDEQGGSEQVGRLNLAYPDGCVFELDA
jgi:hypothetical protein